MLMDIIEPNYVKSLSVVQLKKLCDEIRNEIIDITSKNGGHLGSNLGAVEIILAMHYVFNCPIDKFIFDVGHQCYAHKFLTGRCQLMKQLKKDGGTTGFPNRDESKYDAFIAGHASTSLSAAIGIAAARDLQRQDFNVISLVGDGSLSGGMIYEALNNIGKRKNFIIILNDNGMSISTSVGAIQKYLSRLLSSKFGIILRNKTKYLLQLLRLNFIAKVLRKLVSACFQSNLFEDFGLQYIGVIDGHNIKSIIKALNVAKRSSSDKPIIIHVKTQKGKGYKAAEKHIYNMHSTYSTNTNKSTEELVTYTDVFEHTIAKMAEDDHSIVAITAAMESSVGLCTFANKYPDRFFDVGISEGHAVTFAAGLASQGLKPYFAVYSTFLQRSFDQIYHDVALQNLSVRFIVDKIGMPGGDGKTHAGLYDYSIFNNCSNIRVLSPLDKKDLIYALKFSAAYNDGPIVIRYPKTQVIDIAYNKYNNINVIQKGDKYLVICCTSCITNLVAALKELLILYSSTVIHLYDNKYNVQYISELVAQHYKTFIVDDCCFFGLPALILKSLHSIGRQDILHKIYFVTPISWQINSIEFDSQMAEAGLSKDMIIKRINDVINEQ